jgi:arsenate reductase
MSKLKVLFLCTGNACRSQMAEGWARALKTNELDAYSAGTSPHGLDPHSVIVMQEAGVNISDYRSKDVTELLAIPFDVVVTVCDRAAESCPLFPGAATRIIHHDFPDPPQLAKVLPEAEKLNAYRQVRDEIKAFIETLPNSLNQKESTA